MSQDPEIDISNFDDDQLDAFVKDLFSKSIKELEVIRKEKYQRAYARVKEIKTLTLVHRKMTAKARKLDKQVAKKKKNCIKFAEYIELKKQRMAKMVKETNYSEHVIDILLDELEDIESESDEIDQLYEDKLEEMELLKEDSEKNVQDIKDKNKVAQMELKLKKESLLATQQVLDSKANCLSALREERINTEKKLKELLEKNLEERLQELQSQEALLNAKLSVLSVKHQDVQKQLNELEDEGKNLTSEAEDLPQKLMTLQNASKLVAEQLETEKSLLTNELLTTVAKQSTAQYDENLRLARILRDDLNLHEQLVTAIQRVKKELAIVENKMQELTLEKGFLEDLVIDMDMDIDAESKRKDECEEEGDRLIESIQRLKFNIDAYAQNDFDSSSDDSIDIRHIFTSSSSGGFDESLMSSSLSAESHKVDIANIIANLSMTFDNVVTSTMDPEPEYTENKRNPI